VVNEKIKRTSFRGVVDVVYGGERVIDDNEKAKRKADELGPKISKKQKYEAKQVVQGSPKPESSTVPVVLSKTQQKKQRARELKAAKDINKSNPASSTLAAPSSSREIIETDVLKAQSNG